MSFLSSVSLPFSRLFSVFILLVSPLHAGVVYEIESTKHDEKAPKITTINILVEDGNLKMDIDSQDEDSHSTMIFREDRRDMLILDHKRKTYMIIDQAMMESMAARMEKMNAHMQQALRDVPEERRAQVEEMMKKRVPAQEAQRSSYELNKTDESQKLKGYSCTQYEVLREGRKTGELWLTEWDNIEGGQEVQRVFTSLVDFYHEMMENFSFLRTRGRRIDIRENTGFFEHLKGLEGFPVLTKRFNDDGSLKEESSLRSVTQRAIESSEFEPPAGYKKRRARAVR